MKNKNKLGETTHQFGVLLTWGNMTGGGCWTTTGIAPGFAGESTLKLVDLGAPMTWQLVSLDEGRV